VSGLLRGRLTARARLTALYGAVLAAAGLVMLAASWVALQERLTATPGPDRLVLRLVGPAPSPGTPDRTLPVPAGAFPVTSDQLVTADGRNLQQELEAYQRTVRETAERQLLLQSGAALVVLVGLATVAGYVLAGRVLRPVHEVSALARHLGAHDLHRRIPARDRRRDGDELAELVGVVNGMLDRLERSFEAQRRFLANAGHELRTPIAVQRTLVEVAAHPGAAAEVRELAGRVLPVLDRQQRTVDGLLAIARARAGDGSRGPVDLAALTRTELAALAGRARDRGLEVTSDLPAGGPAVPGDVELLELVVANLLGNAVRHTPRGGALSVRVAGAGDGVRLTVENDGPALGADELAGYAEPFRRGGTARVGGEGAGLGLVIARDAADAAGARLTLEPRPGGGVRAELTLPGG
jgi:signal transduction histidine kinase